ncbi:hypothetical protein [Nitrosopumilus ureiphilus]|uniref:Uncharacterized protein n=1 Tax=Nitrosopumilus ureiphilus TaxID=1470067 RepID=A0A7D5R2L8_9ARCH|nr:hypothetical protein [Nitrosopumilus ureiphilus]QLH07596.1 hypothetical protein C5F50_11335 [Nitrosopumilus ureiphilus]
MNNEIGRKITSLTLMTIMLAGGMTIVAPSMMPAAHAANANLFVSAENSQFDNYMSGPQVIEVVVIDSDIDDTDQGKGEPKVSVNGKKLRMAQAVDGNWYGYFADRDQAQIADSTTSSQAKGEGLDFGTFCGSSDANVKNFLGISVSDSVGVAVPFYNNTNGTIQSNSAGFGVNGSSTGGAITAVCSTISVDGGTNGTLAMNVLRETKELNIQGASSTVGIGQIGINGTKGVSTSTAAFWPFIQLYPLSVGGNVVVQYDKGGGVQSTTLTFDTVEAYAGASLDRSVYTRNAQIHLTVTDLWLNIDPTDEDSWTFGTQKSNATSFGTYYQVFDENGGQTGDAVANGVINIKPKLSALMVETNGLLRVNANTQGATNPVLTIQDNDDSQLICSTANTATSCVTTGNSLAGNELRRGSVPVTITEQGPNSGVFGTYDESDKSVLKITSNAARGTSATIDYNETPVTVLAGFGFATIDIQPIDDEWSSGEEIPVVLVDSDANKNSRADEDLDLQSNSTSLLPTLKTGTPFTLGVSSAPTAMYTSITGLDADADDVGNADVSFTFGENRTSVNFKVESFSQRAIFENATAVTGDKTSNALLIDLNTTIEKLRDSIGDTRPSATNRLHGFNFLNLGLDAINSTAGTVDVYIVNGSLTTTTVSPGANQAAIMVANDVDARSITNINNTSLNLRLFSEQAANAPISLLIVTNSSFIDDTTPDPFVIDFFSFGFRDDGAQASERVANQIIRLELEETGDNTSTFEGTLEYVMLNQLNILDVTTYESLSPIDDEATFIVIEDLTDEDAPRVNYLDLGADGVSTQIADQEEAPTHSGVVSFDSSNYKVADTVTITLEDSDLNTDSDLLEIYTTVSTSGDPAFDTVGRSGQPTFGFGNLGQLLDITFDDERWLNSAQGSVTCGTPVDAAIDDGLDETGFTLVETASDSGVFTGAFQIPTNYCKRSGFTGTSGVSTSVTGTDIEVNYLDFRDASGEIIEVGDAAGIRANTGSISLDRTVYPVPWGTVADFGGTTGASTPNSKSVFPIHATGIGNTSIDSDAKTLGNGDLTIHIRVNDPDFDISASGEDTIAQNVDSSHAFGPVKITVSRGANSVLLAHAGGTTTSTTQRINVANNTSGTGGTGDVRTFGPITEIAPDAGIFEFDFTIRYTDGPASTQCPATTVFTSLDGDSGTSESDRFDTASAAGANYCILQGDIITVEYRDPTDASGDVNTVTDSATFDLRNGVLQSDKSVYIIGSDMILTIIEPDWDLDNDSAETYDIDVIEWDSDAATTTMGDKAISGVTAADFDPEPSDFRETGDSTGIFQIVIEIPKSLNNDNLERGEEIVLEYTDWGPSGADFVGQEDEDVNLTVFTSNFGATVELDQKVYTWTDKVYITIVAPDHNFDSNLIDEIGNTNSDPIKISTRGFNLDTYKLVETGTDTGIFTGEVILTGFSHDADGDLTTGTATNGFDTNPRTGDASGNNKNTRGPTDGFLQTDDDDGLTVSFEFSEDETVVGSALIRWNIGEVQWLEASYPASGTGVVRVIDPDMNLDPESVDNFDVDVWSDSDAGGIDLTVTETNEATGIFEGTVFFTVTDESSGHRLRVAEGDTVTAEYEDNTLPDPYTTADELDITATSLIGTVVPPLERAPAANLRTVDAFGNSLDTVAVDQQVQISADLANGQDREQAFAYLVQIQDGNGVTVSLAWITGSLSSGQSFSPALSWIPTQSGSYTATAFVWESVDNPTALSPPVSTTITVQ